MIIGIMNSIERSFQRLQVVIIVCPQTVPKMARSVVHQSHLILRLNIFSHFSKLFLFLFFNFINCKISEKFRNFSNLKKKSNLKSENGLTLVSVFVVDHETISKCLDRSFLEPLVPSVQQLSR